MRPLFLTLVFAAELAAWGAIGYAAHALTGGGAVGWAAAVASVVAATLAWGRFASPKATASREAALATKVLTFGGACVLLGLTAGWVWAGALAGLVVVAHVGVQRTESDASEKPEAPAASARR